MNKKSESNENLQKEIHNDNKTLRGVSDESQIWFNLEGLKKFFAGKQFLTAEDVVPPDTKYGWVVVAASWIAHFVALGYMYSFGVFINPINREYTDVGRGTISWIGSIASGTALLSSGLIGSFCDRAGFRITAALGASLIIAGSVITSYVPSLYAMYVTYGILVGFGISMSFIPAIGDASQWFEKYRGIATGIAVSGSGVGNFAIPPTATALIKSYGWRRALRYISLFGILAFIGSLFFRRRVPTNRKWEFRIFKDRVFQLLFASGLFIGFGYLVPFVHIVPYAEGKGITDVKAGFLLSMMGIASTIGRIVLGFCADKFGRLRILQISYFCMAVSTCLWPLFKSYPLMSVYAFFFGFFGGGFISTLPAVTADYYGVARLTSIIGLLYPSSALGNVMGPVTAGLLYDRLGSYTIASEIAGGSMFVGFVITLFIPRKNITKVEPIQDEQSELDPIKTDDP